MFKFVHLKSVEIKLWYLSSRVLCLQVRLRREWSGPKCNTQQCKSVNSSKLYSWGQVTEGSLDWKAPQQKIFSMKSTKILFLQKNLKIKLNLRRGKKQQKKKTHSCFQEQTQVLECRPVQRNKEVGAWGGGVVSRCQQLVPIVVKMC